MIFQILNGCLRFIYSIKHTICAHSIILIVVSRLIFKSSSPWSRFILYGTVPYNVETKVLLHYNNGLNFIEGFTVSRGPRFVDRDRPRSKASKLIRVDAHSTTILNELLWEQG